MGGPVTVCVGYSQDDAVPEVYIEELKKHIMLCSDDINVGAHFYTSIPRGPTNNTVFSIS